MGMPRLRQAYTPHPVVDQSAAHLRAYIDGRDAISVQAESSASMLRQQLRIAPGDLGRVRFSWKVPGLIEQADLALREGDDAPVRVVLAFEGDRSRFSPRDAVLSELARALTGEAAATEETRMMERGALRMDPLRHSVTWKGKEVALTVTEFLLLQALAQRPGFVKSRDQLMDVAYDDQVYVDDRTIDSHIKRLRKKMRSVDDTFSAIETLYGIGYRYNEE